MSFVRNEDEYGFTDDDHDDEYLLKKVASEILRRESSSMPDESKTVICGRAKVQFSKILQVMCKLICNCRFVNIPPAY